MEGVKTVDITSEYINPISVARVYLEKVKVTFCAFEDSKPPNQLEAQVADLLIEKFAKITSDYAFVEEYENDFDDRIANSSKESSFSVSASNLPNALTTASALSSCKTEHNGIIQHVIPTEFMEGSQENSEAFLHSSSSECYSEDLKNDKDYSATVSGKSVSRFNPNVTVKQKAKILKLIEDNPGYSFKSIHRKYPCYAKPGYYKKWKTHVANGGTPKEIFYEIDRFTHKCAKEARDEFKPVHDIDIRRWALQKASEFPSIRNTFRASKRWIAYFKKRVGLSSRKVTKIVSKRNLRTMEEILSSVENFRHEIQSLQEEYSVENIWNTDQVGFNYEYIDTRTLSWTGEKITYGAGFSPTNKATHSYTVQYIISAAGKIIGPAFVCLQEQSGRIGDQVQQNLFTAPNLCITCTKSGKLSKSQVEYFFNQVAKPNIFGRLLYIIDSWGAHIKCDAYDDVGDGNELTVKLLPKNSTPFAQPMDVYFNRELKYFVRRIYSYANLNDLEKTSRNDVLRVQCLAHFTLSAPIFESMIRYSWIKSGLVNLEREYFDNVRDACFTFREKQCCKEGCSNAPFYKCSWCRNVICFHHLFHELHPMECSVHPLI